MVSKNSWTLVTGGAQGLGSAICRLLAKNGYPVVIHYHRHEAQAKKVLADCEKYAPTMMIQGDFLTSESVEKFLNTYKKLKISTKHLVNNVGNYSQGGFATLAQKEITCLFQTNFFAPIRITQFLLPSIKKEAGSIVNIGTSGLPFKSSEVHAAAYYASKLALWMATKSFAKELTPFRVRVNMISPGYMENAVDLPKDLTKIPWKRPADLDEIANAVKFFIDSTQDYITGQNLEVAGGVGL